MRKFECPGGDAKQYKSDNIDIRWYSETKTITLGGKLKDEIKDKLFSLTSISSQPQLASAENENEACIIDDHSEGKKDHSSATEKRKLSLQSLNSHLEAISITKNVDANTTAVNNTY